MARAGEIDGLLPMEYAGIHIDEVLCRIGMTRDRLIQIADEYTNPSIFEDRPTWGRSPKCSPHE